MDYQIRLSLLARRDLQDIVRYIAIDSPSRAREFSAFLFSKTKMLAHQPLAGRVVPEAGFRPFLAIFLQPMPTSAADVYCSA